MVTLSATVDRATRAEAVSGDLRALARARSRVGAAAVRVVAAQEPLTRFGASDWTTTTAARDGSRPSTSTVSPSRRPRRPSGGWLADRVRLGELGRSTTAARAALEQQRTALARATTTVDQAEADVRAGQAATAARTAASADAEAWAEVHRLATDLSAAQARCATLRERAMTVRETEQDAREAFLAAQQARVDGMAAELAGRLVDGEPCAVCGSRQHPSPTVPGAADTSAARRRTRRAGVAVVALGHGRRPERPGGGGAARLDADRRPGGCPGTPSAGGSHRSRHPRQRCGGRSVPVGADLVRGRSSGRRRVPAGSRAYPSGSRSSSPSTSWSAPRPRPPAPRPRCSSGSTSRQSPGPGCSTSTSGSVPARPGPSRSPSRSTSGYGSRRSRSGTR